MYYTILYTLSACTVLDESGELVSDPGCMSSAIIPTPTPTPTIDSKDPDSSSDGLVAGVATAVGTLVVVIIVVVVVVVIVAVAYMMTRTKFNASGQSIYAQMRPFELLEKCR